MSTILDVPNHVLSELTHIKLPPRAFCSAAGACVKLYTCAKEAVQKLARHKCVPRRDGESNGEFAFRVLRAFWWQHRDAKGIWNTVVYAFGLAMEGQLGLGEEHENEYVYENVYGTFCYDTSPVLVRPLCGKHVVQVECGHEHTIVLTSDGVVYAFGDGSAGQLGLGSFANQFVPMEVRGALHQKRVTQVAAGAFHTAVLTDDGNAFVFGDSDYMIPLGCEAKASVPCRVEELVGKHVVQVSCGAREQAENQWKPKGGHTVLLTRQGEVFTFGPNHHHQLGHGDRGLIHGFVIVKVGQPLRVNTLKEENVVQVVAGCESTAFLTQRGTVFTCGSGKYGMQGCGEEADVHVPRKLDKLIGKHVIRLAAAYDHMSALTNDGEVFMFGATDDGRCGEGTLRCDTIAPCRVDTLLGHHVTQVAVGGAHTGFITRNGDVFTSGAGYYGKLGHGEEENEPKPRRLIFGYDIHRFSQRFGKMEAMHISAGGSHTLVLCVI